MKVIINESSKEAKFNLKEFVYALNGTGYIQGEVLGMCFQYSSREQAYYYLLKINMPNGSTRLKRFSEHLLYRTVEEVCKALIDNSIDHTINKHK